MNGIVPLAGVAVQRYLHFKMPYLGYFSLSISGAVGAQFLGGPKAQIFRQRDNFSDKTNSSEPPYNVLFLKVS